MAGPAPARLAALQILRAVRSGGLADRALERSARGMQPRERAFAHELVFGVLRLRSRLDHRLSTHSQRPLARIDPDVLDILRIGAYQLTELSGVPDYAAISESVELAKRAQRSAAGFVNGVLQSLRREPDASTFPSLERDPIGHLTTWGAHPRWLVERWVARFGADATSRLCEVANSRPQLYLRALGDVADVRERLTAAGVMTEGVPGVDRSLRVVQGGAAEALDAAPVIVQDPAAGRVVDFCGAVPDRVIDIAAAPGGKALGLAGDAPRAERLVVASDLSWSRLRRLRDNVGRVSRQPPYGLGDIGVAPVVADGRSPPYTRVPLVLLDAPCTGTGTLRRHPDGKWRIGPADLAALVRVQAELLDAVAQLVEPGGLLVYATCSLEPEENEVQVLTFIERHGGFRVERGDSDVWAMDEDGMLRVLPHVHGADGAFAARLRRD